jgi:hypothetical protein
LCQSADPTLTRAQALRQAMLALIDTASDGPNTSAVHTDVLGAGFGWWATEDGNLNWSPD